MSPTWAIDQALTLWANEALRLPVAAILAGCLLAIIFGNSNSKKYNKQKKEADPPLPKLGKPNPIVRLVRRPKKPVTVGGVTFDRAWRHVGIIATTGARKSTLLALMAEQLDVPCIIITGDHAPPLENYTRSVAGWVWRARGGIGWYPWGGPLESAVQRAEYMHPATSGDVGVGRAMFKQAARVAWSQADDRGEVRTLAQLRAALPTVIRGQTSAMMAENWQARLLELEQSLGDSLGASLDLVEALRQGTSVMVSLNSFQDTSNRGRFASIAVLEALRAADTLGNIGVIIDEVGLIGGDLFGDAVRTFRVRHVTGLFASQIAEDFPPEVRGNVNVWFLGQQSGGDKASRQWSSEATFGRIPASSFGEHALPHGKFYVVHGGYVEQATIPTWQDRHTRPPAELPACHLLLATPEEKVKDLPASTISAEPRVDAPIVEGPPEMPLQWRGSDDMPLRDRQQLENIWLHHRFPGGLYGCHESTYAPATNGRVQASFRGKPVTVYLLSLVLAEGHDLAQVQMLTAAGELTVDHLAGCENKLCTKVEHLGWEARGPNTSLYFERRRQDAAA